jgi:GNAT superfamily N-acetyltransferase
MYIRIEQVATVRQWTTVFRIRRQVFHDECGSGFELLPGPGAAGVHHFLACDGRGTGIATLSVVETTGEVGLHRQYGLAFPLDHRIARYSQLAVLPPYRGLGIAEYLIQEAQRQVIHPNSFDFGWLLFPAHRAAHCKLTRSFGFVARPEVFATDFGRCQVLVRDETAWRASQGAPGWRTTRLPREIEALEFCGAD